MSAIVALMFQQGTPLILQGIFDIVMADFQHHYMPACELSLDKGTVPTKNSLSTKQFIKDKPNQMGYKDIYIL